MAESMGLYDSDTGASLMATSVLDLGLDADGEPVAIAYCETARGRIAQVRAGSLRSHYFVDEDLLDEDASRVGRWLGMGPLEAVQLIRENAPPAKQP